MTLGRLRPLSVRLFRPLSAAIARRGVTPRQLTLLSMIAAAAAGVGFALGSDAAVVGAAGLTLFNGLLDMLDGQVARLTDVADARGDFLDHTVDRYADIVVVLGIAAGTGRWRLGALALVGVLMTAHLGTQAQVFVGEREYGGLFTRADRIVVLAAAGLLTPLVATLGPYSPLGWTLVGYAALGNYTAFERVVTVWRSLE